VSDDRRWRRYWRALCARFGRDVDEELRFHVEMRASELAEKGMDPEAAAREAERRFGNRREVRRRLDRIERRRRGLLRFGFLLEELWQDIRYGIRGLLHRPSFTIAAASSLALGIGATTAVLAIVDPLLFRSLGVPAADELVVIGAVNKSVHVVAPLVSVPAGRELAARGDLFTDVALMRMQIGAVRLTGSGQGERRLFFFVSGRYFPLFRVRPAAGRLLIDDDDRRKAPVVVLAHRFWKEAYRADPMVIGRPLYVNGLPLTIVGVAPPGFQGVEHLVAADFFVPIGVESVVWPTGRDSGECPACPNFQVIARRAGGRSVADIQRVLDVESRRMIHDVPDLGEGYRLLAFPEPAARLTIAAASTLGTVGTMFLGLAGLVLLAGSVNATNLVLTRASSRKTELNLRLALGASRGRLARQLLTENVVLALVGLAGGYVLAWLLAVWLERLPIPFDFPLGWHVAIDRRTFGFGAAIAVGSGLLAGLGPALLYSGRDVQRRLREGRGGVGRGGERVRSALVLGQVAASVVVLVFAGLFVSSIRQAEAIDTGLVGDQVVTMGIDATLARYDRAKALLAYDRIERELKSLPMVTNVALTTGIPLSPSMGITVSLYSDETIADRRTGDGIGSLAASVGPDYFTTMGIPILEGRAFRLEDDRAGARVAIVNQRAAELMWPGRSPIGRRFRLGPGEPFLEVVGIAKTGRYILIGESPTPFVYQPFKQGIDDLDAFVAVKVRGEPELAFGALRAAVDRADPSLVPSKLTTLRTRIDDGFNGLLPVRLGAVIASLAGVLALLLTVVGLYGLIAYGVAQRTREIGVRIALGASPGAVVGGILGQGARLAGAGIVVGLAVAVLVTRKAAGLLIGVPTTNPAVLGAVALALLGVALGSAFLPARRAARLDATQALRSD
jgi:predicted permease